MKLWTALTLGVILCFAVAMSGCATMLLSKALDKDSTLSPEQIKAYNEVGSSVYGCFSASGPPPSGALIFLIVPKGAAVTFRFTENCHLLSQ